MPRPPLDLPPREAGKIAGCPVAGRRQPDARPRGRDREEIVGHLEKDAGPVTGQGITAAGAAVGEIFEYLETLTDDPVAPPAVHVDDEAHAAGVVFGRGVVEPLGGREAGAGGPVRLVWPVCHESSFV